MRIFVTGATGLLGSALLPVLKEHDVTAVGLEDGDILDDAWLRDRLGDARPEVVVHLAACADVDGAEADPDLAFRINAEGTRRVAVAAESCGARVLALSTDFVFDGRLDRPYTEDDDPRPLGVYGRSKLAGELALQEVSTRWAVVRSAWLFGPGGKNFVETILRLVEERGTLDVVDDQVGSPTLTGDLATALVLLVERRARGLLHVVNRGEVSWFGLAREAVRLAGGDPERIRPTTTAALARPAPRPAYSVLETSRARERYGVDLRDWREALRDYLRSTGRLRPAGEVT